MTSSFSFNPVITRRTALIGLAGAGAAGLLAACTGTPAARTSTQSLSIWTDQAFSDALTASIKGFQKDFGVKLDIQPLAYDDIIKNYLQAAPTGSGPSLADFNIDHLGRVAYAEVAGKVDFGKKLSKIDPRAVAGWTVDGSMRGLPLVLESTNMWRNPDLVAEPVKTWDDLIRTASDLRGKVKYPFLAPDGGYTIIGMLSAFGGYVFKQNEDGTYDVNDVGFDNAGSIAALQVIEQGVRDGWIVAGLAAEAYGDTWADGQIGLQLSGPWLLSSYEATSTPYAIDMIPSGPAGVGVPWLSARGLGVNPLHPDYALAQTFLTEYLAADGPMSTFAKATSKLSSWVPVQDSSASETTRAFAAASVNAQPIPQNRELGGLWAPCTDQLELLFQGRATAKEVATSVAQQLRDSVKAAQN